MNASLTERSEVEIYYRGRLEEKKVLESFFRPNQDTVDVQQLLTNGSSDLGADLSLRNPPVLKILSREQESSSITYQKWRGVVKSVSEETFIAYLTDLSENAPDEEAEFLCSAVSDDDRELLSEGAVFYWCVGYLTSYSKSVTITSVLRFQRLPVFSKESVNLAHQKASEIRNNIRWL
jgi:hypothetical protein